MRPNACSVKAGGAFKKTEWGGAICDAMAPQEVRGPLTPGYLLLARDCLGRRRLAHAQRWLLT
jgi:hypothetical protein